MSITTVTEENKCYLLISNPFSLGFVQTHCERSSMNFKSKYKALFEDSTRNRNCFPVHWFIW